jgi:hypothetical protein
VRTSVEIIELQEVAFLVQLVCVTRQETIARVRGQHCINPAAHQTDLSYLNTGSSSSICSPCPSIDGGVYNIEVGRERFLLSRMVVPAVGIELLEASLTAAGISLAGP